MALIDRLTQSQMEQLMEQSDVSLPHRTDIVGEQVDAPANDRARRLGPDWDIDSMDLTWISNNRDWNDVLCDLKNLVNKPLNLVRSWFRSK